MLEKNLGTDYIDVQTEGYPDDGFSTATQRACNYAMQRCTWMADYLDPLSYTDPFRILQNRGSCIYMADGMADVSDTETEIVIERRKDGMPFRLFICTKGYLTCRAKVVDSRGKKVCII